MKILLPILLAFALAGCTHVSGVVTEETGKPVPSAIISIGRPDAIANYGIHHVDRAGKFNFFVFALDESNVYVYDNNGDPRLTMQHLDPAELSENMHIKLYPIMGGGGDSTP